MNIKVAAFTVSEKSSNTQLQLRLGIVYLLKFSGCFVSMMVSVRNADTEKHPCVDYFAIDSPANSPDNVGRWSDFSLFLTVPHAEKVGCLFTFLKGEWQILSLTGRKKIQAMSRNLSFYMELNGTD